MRPVLQNQPQIEALSNPLMQALRALVAAIQTGWNSQHNGAGAHTAVTAESLAVTPGASVLSKVRLNQVTYEHTAVSPTINNLTTPGLATASCLRIVPNQVLEVNGIDATGREPGDLLLVLNCDTTVSSPDDIWLHLEDTAAVDTNRFATTTASPASPYVLNGGRGVWLIYDWQTTVFADGPRLLRWRIIDQA